MGSSKQTSTVPLVGGVGIGVDVGVAVLDVGVAVVPTTGEELGLEVG